MKTEIIFKEKVIHIATEHRIDEFEYTRGLLEAFVNKGVKLTFSNWIKILNRI